MRSKSFIAFMVLAVIMLSCNKEDNVDPNEEELITTLKVTLTAAGSAPQVFSFKDVDGPGGQAPSLFDSIIIDANKSYSASLQFLNESASPVDDITLEVAAESDDHQVYYEPAGVALAVSNLNTDSKGLPLGLTSTWNTGAPGKGTLKITLKHKPGAKATGDPVSKGETDVEVGFGVRIK